MPDALLQNYFDLVARVDAYIAGVTQTFEDHIACRKGCDACCRFLNLFPVEAFALSRAFQGLPEKDKTRIKAQVREDEETCPLLVDHACMVYGARPVICRTHGYPIYIQKKGEAMVDFCPENFKGLTTLPREAMMDLDQLNAVLTAVNQHFISQLADPLPDRISVSRALDLWEALTPE